MEEDPELRFTDDRGKIWKGIGLLALLHLLQLPFIPLFFGWIFIGVSQFVYAIPALVILNRRGKAETAMGLWIGVGITGLLNAICFGVLCAPY